MSANLSKEDIVNSLRQFKSRRDALLHEDTAAFEHHLERFMAFCRTDPLVQKIITPLQSQFDITTEGWWQEACDRQGHMSFPENPAHELLLRYRILEDSESNPRRVYQFGVMHGMQKLDDRIGLFRTIVIRPFADELTHQLGDAADIAMPEARAMQAVPLHRIPSPREVKIFLSHKSFDKPLVHRYYQTLKEIGFDPWLDEPNMPAGANFEREIFQGFEESCAAVFFITEHFRDEKYLAAEVDYAIQQKRKKDKKFAIITLRYPNAAAVPNLLTSYIYKEVENDLHGFYELLRALPIELGPTRWKTHIVQ